MDLGVLELFRDLDELALQGVRHVGTRPSPIDAPERLSTTIRRVEVQSDDPRASEAALRAHLQIPDPAVTQDGTDVHDPRSRVVVVDQTPWTRPAVPSIDEAVEDWELVESEDYVGTWWMSGELLSVDRFAGRATEYDAAEAVRQVLRKADRGLLRRVDIEAGSDETAFHGDHDDLARVRQLIGLPTRPED